MTMLGAYELNQIVTGDARQLAQGIPDESVDLIFTDPVYDRIDDYRWLAETAARVLKPTGNALAFVNSKWHTTILKYAPTDKPTLSAVQTSGPSPMNGRVIAKTYHLVWWGSGHLVGYMPDGFLSTTWSNGSEQNHVWIKNPRYISTTLYAFTDVDAIVVDFFCGGGTIPAMCKMLGRNYLAFEIDPDTAERARERVRNTQPPLFVLQPEQVGMELDA